MSGDMLASIYDKDGIQLDVFGKGVRLRLWSDIALTTVPSAVQYLKTSGFVQTGRGGATYVRAISEPSHPGKAQSADGAWWELVEASLVSDMFGTIPNGDGNGGGTDNAIVLQAALTAAGALGVPLLVSKGVYRCDGGLTIPAGV